jgi:hypothetical protein
MNQKWKPEQTRIVSGLKSRVKQPAHRLALADELKHRTAIVARLNALAAQGKRSPELHATQLGGPPKRAHSRWPPTVGCPKWA